MTFRVLRKASKGVEQREVQATSNLVKYLEFLENKVWNLYKYQVVYSVENLDQVLLIFWPTDAFWDKDWKQHKFLQKIWIYFQEVFVDLLLFNTTANHLIFFSSFLWHYHCIRLHPNFLLCSSCFGFGSLVLSSEDPISFSPLDVLILSFLLFQREAQNPHLISPNLRLSRFSSTCSLQTSPQTRMSVLICHPLHHQTLRLLGHAILVRHLEQTEMSLKICKIHRFKEWGQTLLFSSPTRLKKGVNAFNWDRILGLGWQRIP